MAAVPLPPLNLTGGAGGSAGQSGAQGGYLSNPFATGEMAVSYGSSKASTAAGMSPWVLGGIALAGLLLWKKLK